MIHLNFFKIYKVTVRNKYIKICMNCSVVQRARKQINEEKIKENSNHSFFNDKQSNTQPHMHIFSHYAIFLFAKVQ